MKLILLYGAPAVGKYTVGKVLAKKTKYKLIHIHSIYDFLEDIFGKEKYEVSLNILNNICVEVFEQAAKNKIKGLVFT